MTVAIIANYLGPKLGIGQYIDQLIQPLVQSLRQESIDVSILASPNAVQNTPSLQKLSSVKKASGEALLEVIPQLDNPPVKRYLWFALNFNRYCRRANINSVVWLSNPIVMPWHPATLAVLHDVNEWKAEDKYGSRIKTALRSLIYLDSSLRYAKKIVAISQATANDILHFRPKKFIKEKLTVIPNGANSQLEAIAPIDISQPEHPFVLSVGRIDPAAKRLPEAVSLVSAMRKLSGVPWELHMMGGMNASTQSSGTAFLEEVESLPWVTYHGHVDDATLAQWYRNTDAVVFLSDNEGFGFPVAEAACFNRWAIVSRENAASAEAGSDALISVDADNSNEAAATVLERLQQGKPPVVSLPSWQDAAVAYANEIFKL